MNEKSFLSWSGGKDSSLSLYKAKESGITIAKLLTTINKEHGRISMHGVRSCLLEQQAAAIGLPLQLVTLPEQPDMITYEVAMHQAYQQLKKEDFTQAVFGDIFLEDLKQYREQQLANEGFNCLFPLWKRNSRELMTEFMLLGFKAIVVCVNHCYLDQSFCGRLLNESFLNDLPPGIDVCGENGEYHSFVFDGPFFANPVPFEKGETVFRQYPAPVSGKTEDATPEQPAGFYFCDLLSAG